jgi:hypothetical protein
VLTVVAGSVALVAAGLLLEWGEASPAVVTGRVEDSWPPNTGYPMSSTRIYLYRGVVTFDSDGLPSEAELVSETKTRPDGTFELRAPSWEPSEGGYFRATVIVKRPEDAGLFSRVFCAQTTIEARLADGPAGQWEARNGDPISVVLDVPYDHAHVCFTPVLP